MVEGSTPPAATIQNQPAAQSSCRSKDATSCQCPRPHATLSGEFCAYKSMTTLSNQVSGLLHIRDFLTPTGEAERWFGPEIAMLTVGENCVMCFRNESTGDKVDKFLERASLLLLAGEARKSWTHEIPKRKSDDW